MYPTNLEKRRQEEWQKKEMAKQQKWKQAKDIIITIIVIRGRRRRVGRIWKRC
jgi:hypothetical protein